MVEKFQVCFRENDLTIQIYSLPQKTSLYEIDLEKCNDSAETLDYILQLMGKGWATPQLIFDVLREIERACEVVFGFGAQGVFCPFGNNQQVDWKKKKLKTIK